MPIDHEETSPLLAELATLRQRVAELSREADEARQAEALLRQKNAEQTALLHAIPAPVFFKSRDHRYVFVNQAYADSLNRAVEDVMGKHDEEIFQGEQASTFHDSDEAVMATGVPRYNVEFHCCTTGQTSGTSRTTSRTATRTAASSGSWGSGWT